MSSSRNFVNGVHGRTGRYLSSPFARATPPTLHGGALDPATERFHRWRKERCGISNVDRGLVEGVSPLDLSQAGWGVVFAADIDDEVKDKLAPLLNRRKEQAGKLYREVKYEPDTSKMDFLGSFGIRPGPVDPRQLPYYLLLVGDPSSMPFELQSLLDVQYAVGRLHFDDPEDYGRYAEAVVQAETGKVPLPPREVTHFAVDRPGDNATERMAAELVQPLVEHLTTLDKERNPDPWPQHLLRKDEATKARLGRILGGKEMTALLVTASHGVYFPSGDSLQRSDQGALVCQDWEGPSEIEEAVGPENYFAAHDLNHNPSLHGLIAIHYACFSAGVPELSSYDTEFGTPERLTPKPFVSQLCQKLLSCGALAVLGHVDRSWPSSFTWEHPGDQARAFDNTVLRLLRGHPVGSATEFINQQYAELSVDLSQRWEARQRMRDGSRESFNRLWQANNDARNFVVIGDPAVRLLPCGSFDESVQEEAESLPAETFLSEPDSAEVPSAGEGLVSTIRPPDLEIRVTVETKGSETFLSYVLHSSAAQANGFHHHTIRSKPIKTRPQDYQAALLKELEGLNSGAHAEGSLAVQKEIPADLVALGRKLYRELFPPEMQAAYRVFREKVQTLLITSDEPWIPWELVKPYDDEGPDLIDDDFLCAKFQLTRWLSGGMAPVAAMRVERIVCVEAGKALPKKPLPTAEKELRWLQDLAQRSNVDDRSLPHASYPQLKERLEEGGIDLLHLVGHGRFDSGDPDQSSFYLEDGRPLRPLDLHGEIQTRTKGRRPLVFLNACQVGQQGYSLTGLGGWAPRWVGDCGCGAFVAPLWTVNDRLAHEFAIAFYSALKEGRTFGQAAAVARRRVRELDPSRPTWLAFTVYAHPNGRVQWGAQSMLLEERPHNPGFANPVLYLRATGGRLWSTHAASGIPGEPILDEDPDPLLDSRNSESAFGIPGHLPLPPRSFLGRDDDLHKLKKRLLRSARSGPEQGEPLLLTGWPGVGKTTMTTALANDPELLAAFPDGVLWTSLDQYPSLFTELNSWCIALGSSGLSPGATLSEVSRHLGELLRERRVLILVDDVWETAHAVPFLVAGSGCAMLVTSRLDSVAHQLTPTPGAVFRLSPLSETAGLELLRSRAPQVVANHPKQCRLLVREFEGLPLALHVAGRLLHEESRLGWGVDQLLEQLQEGKRLLEEAAPSDRVDLRSQTLPTVAVLLAKSTDRLSADILECFAFLGAFAPKPATFDFEAIQALWRVENPKPTVRALVNRGLLEPVGTGRFRMHALLVAHARSLLED